MHTQQRLSIHTNLPAGAEYANRVAQDHVSRRAHRRGGSSSAKLLVAHSQGNAGGCTATCVPPHTHNLDLMLTLQHVEVKAVAHRYVKDMHNLEVLSWAAGWRLGHSFYVEYVIRPLGVRVHLIRLVDLEHHRWLGCVSQSRPRRGHVQWRCLPAWTWVTSNPSATHQKTCCTLFAVGLGSGMGKKTNLTSCISTGIDIASKHTWLSVAWQACCFVSVNLKVISRTGSSARLTCSNTKTLLHPPSNKSLDVIALGCIKQDWQA